MTATVLQSLPTVMATTTRPIAIRMNEATPRLRGEEAGEDEGDSAGDRGDAINRNQGARERRLSQRLRRHPDPAVSSCDLFLMLSPVLVCPCSVITSGGRCWIAARRRPRLLRSAGGLN